MPSSYDFYNKTSSGVNMMTISGGHTLDLVEPILGAIIEVDARTEILWPVVKLTDTGEESVRETADREMKAIRVAKYGGPEELQLQEVAQPKLGQARHWFAFTLPE